MSFLLSKVRKPNSGHKVDSKQTTPAHTRIVATSYTSKKVDIPDDFLKSPAPDAQAITLHTVNFSESILPEYEGRYAVVLDNVLSPSECKQLIEYAEQSAGASDEGVDNNGWKAAMVNAGVGREVMMTEYRNSDRIIWDDQEVMNRLWERCTKVDGVLEEIGTLDHKPLIQGRRGQNSRWIFSRLNERMRFLSMVLGSSSKNTVTECIRHQIIRSAHSSHSISTSMILYKQLHLASALRTEQSPSSPRTNTESFVSHRRIDVHPKAGRVLLFQHADLLHSGDYVTSGIKHTMRTDLMYKRVPKTD
ncbi:SubName: Full=Uncharacterized protein {ECO:0000313/EMBL:CCA75455.1} [Serendipita indica DSM 11827]|nr:SubName: Full=Uncharacterized protein {ECO:0000313/EMBL:CCA75455.1} [Serendipita indica DSM 11827]